MREAILTAAADPNTALALLILGALLAFAEFSAPGKVIPGAVGSVLILLGASALTAPPLALALLAVSGLCIVLHAFRPGKLLPGMGAAAFVGGAWKLADGRIRFATAAGLGLPFALITAFLLSTAVRARRNKTAGAQA